MKYQQVVAAVNKIISEYTLRLTVRQIWYRLVSPPYQLFENTITNYKGFDKILTRARENNHVDWTKIEDRSRGTYGPSYPWFGMNVRLGAELDTFSDPKDYIDYLFKQLADKFYDQPYWADQPQHIEVFVEKDALASLFVQVAEEKRVLVYPSRGYSSFTKVMEAIRRLPKDKPVKILHFADHDPSGMDMTEDLIQRLRNYSAGDELDLQIKRIALTIDQVKRWDLAPNPTKAADSRSPNYVAKFGDSCWELDAVRPNDLQDIIRKAIQEEVDQDEWDKTEERITEQREKIAKALGKSKKSLDRLQKRIKDRL